MSRIKDISALEILDSRGNPTLSTAVKLEDGSVGVASVPSGASTGSREALELRDGDDDRYNGKGVLQAVANVNKYIFELLQGVDCYDQKAIDAIMIEADGTANKSKFGANAILSVSLACCKAAANSKKIELYKYINEAFSGKEYSMPLPMMNILNGGSHADNNIDIQEFMIQPVGAETIKQAVQMGAEVFHCLKSVLKKKNLNTAVGDEGGFAPNLASNEYALELITQAVEVAGYQMEKDFTLALDCAASEFYKDGHYLINNQKKTTTEFLDYIEELCNKYPINSIEDLLDENDWQGWQIATERLGSKIQLVGDDLFVTDVGTLQKGIDKGVANSILIKYNQIGTLTETINAINLAKANNYGTVISHRSGETEDSTIADLAVALSANQIKTGSMCRSDRVAKYNRLLQIELQLSALAPYCKIP